MENSIQTWVNIGVMAILAATNIGLFIWQRSKIKWYESSFDKLQKQLEAQDKRIDTYQKIVNLEEMEKGATFKANAMLHDVLKNREEFKGAVKEVTHGAYSQELHDLIIRQLVFIKHIFTHNFQMEQKEQERLISRISDRHQDWLLKTYRLIQITTDKEKDPTE